jgi:hypothetical protein
MLCRYCASHLIHCLLIDARRFILQLLLFTATQGAVLACIAAIGLWSEAPPEDQMSGRNIGVVTGIVFVVIVLAVL